ncbi:rhomboid-like protein [Mycolicibacterium baixiangningiae]|uniref:rhomboid-like protein n=1 Tax=Mycolicibacterium baixiangningiae TaxID=2761578 RepID=UPI0018D04FD5|nr:rhomboid-like protein [Mycolicibacterium baixiangningiae]
MTRALGVVGRCVAGAPATFIWLAVLAVTTRVQRAAGRARSQLLRNQSTNLNHLSNEPTRVLAASLFWLDGSRWWPYVPPFVAVLAPAERRLGTWRWLVAGTSAHVTGTYVGQGYLRRSIRAEQAPPRLADAHDVGVSYFLLGVAGTLSAYLPARHRTRLRVAGVAVLAANAVVRPTFTEVGHLSAFVTGLTLSPLATNRERHPYPGTEVYARR